jgi:uncharacterized oxidoreductase
MDLRNDTIIVTGGTSGIGLEMAEQLSAEGNTVIVTGRDPERLRLLGQTHPELRTYSVEVTDLASVEEFSAAVLADFPGVNVLINNAGLMHPISFQTAGARGITDEINVNLIGPVLVTQSFLPHLLKQQEAGIVNVTSGIAYFPFDKAPLYSASKLGLHSYTQSLRAQLKGTNVRVFELAPPRTTKPMFNGSEEDNREVDRIPKMPIATVVATMIAGIRKNRTLILPGLSKLLRVLGKIRL